MFAYVYKLIGASGKWQMSYVRCDETNGWQTEESLNGPAARSLSLEETHLHGRLTGSLGEELPIYCSGAPRSIQSLMRSNS